MERGGVLAVLYKCRGGLAPCVTLGESQPISASLSHLQGVTLPHLDCSVLGGEGQSDPYVWEVDARSGHAMN